MKIDSKNKENSINFQELDSILNKNLLLYNL